MEEREKLEEEEYEGYVCSPGPTKEGGNLRKPSGRREMIERCELAYFNWEIEY